MYIYIYIYICLAIVTLANYVCCPVYCPLVLYCPGCGGRSRRRSRGAAPGRTGKSNYIFVRSIVVSYLDVLLVYTYIYIYIYVYISSYYIIMVDNDILSGSGFATRVLLETPFKRHFTKKPHTSYFSKDFI